MSEDTKMFCAKCGAVLPDNAEKCNQCGARVRIRPDHSGKKKIGGKTGSSRSDESALRSEKNAEKAIQEESLMDPVFFKEAGKDVDVQAIIKIAHGEDPYKAEMAEEDKGDAVRKDYSFSRSASRKSEPGDDEKGDPELNMESYLESLPLIEKIRRKIKEYHHKRAESADEKRMKKHLERASKHFSEVESEDLKAEERRLQKEAARRREEKLRAGKAEAEKLRAQKAEAEKLQAQKAEAEKLLAEKAEAEKLLSEKAEAEKLRAEKEEAERAAKEALLKKEKATALSSSQADGEGSDSGRQGEDKLAAEKAEADLAEAARLQEEAIRRHEEEKRAERIAAAARQRERARAGTVRRQDEKQQPQSPAPQEKEGLEVIRLHGRDQSEEARVREEENADEAALLQEAERAAEAARIQQEEEARIHAAQHDQSVRQREEKDDRIQKILNTGSEEYDSFRPISEHNRKELSKEDLQLEKLRRQRKYRNNQPDRLDEFLGKYGLTKETAVRIATLFLIVVLSVIYVLGRGSSKTAPDHTGTGTGTTGIESVEEQVGDGTVTEPSEDSEETQLPTGGGDFENN